MPREGPDPVPVVAAADAVGWPPRARRWPLAA